MQSEVAVKQGVVRDWNGKPVVDARVSVSLKEKTFGETRTDARGEFTVQAPGARSPRTTCTSEWRSRQTSFVIVVDQMLTVIRATALRTHLHLIREPAAH